MWETLQAARKLGIDFDGTLIGAENIALVDFIAANPDKTYYIVTHRTPAQASTIPDELRQFTSLPIDAFAKVVPTPERIVFEFDEDQRMRRAAGLPPIERVPPDSLFPGEHKFVHWKGFACRKIGATVLVDDIPRLSQPGCDQYGITLVNPMALRGYPASRAA